MPSNDLIPFDFTRYADAIKSMPYDKADDLLGSSNFVFFKNGLWTQYDVRKFLSAQDRDRLEFFCALFNVEPDKKTKTEIIRSIMDNIIVG